MRYAGFAVGCALCLAAGAPRAWAGPPSPPSEESLQDNGVGLPTGSTLIPHRLADATEVRNTDSSWALPDGTPVAGMPAFYVPAHDRTLVIEVLALTSHIRLDAHFMRSRVGPDGTGNEKYSTTQSLHWMNSLLDSQLYVETSGAVRVTLPNGSQLFLDSEPTVTLTDVDLTPHPDFSYQHIAAGTDTREHYIVHQESTGYTHYYAVYLVSGMTLWKLVRVDWRGQMAPPPVPPTYDEGVLEKVLIEYQPGWLFTKNNSTVNAWGDNPLYTAALWPESGWFTGFALEHSPERVKRPHPLIQPTGLHSFVAVEGELVQTGFAYVAMDTNPAPWTAYLGGHHRYYPADAAELAALSTFYPPAALYDGTPPGEPAAFDPLSALIPFYTPVPRWDGSWELCWDNNGSITEYTFLEAAQNWGWRWSLYYPGYDPPPTRSGIFPVPPQSGGTLIDCFFATGSQGAADFGFQVQRYFYLEWPFVAAPGETPGAAFRAAQETASVTLFSGGLDWLARVVKSVDGAGIGPFRDMDYVDLSPGLWHVWDVAHGAYSQLQYYLPLSPGGISWADRPHVLVKRGGELHDWPQAPAEYAYWDTLNGVPFYQQVYWSQGPYTPNGHDETFAHRVVVEEWYGPNAPDFDVPVSQPGSSQDGTAPLWDDRRVLDLMMGQLNQFQHWAVRFPNPEATPRDESTPRHNREGRDGKPYVQNSNAIVAPIGIPEAFGTSCLPAGAEECSDPAISLPGGPFDPLVTDELSCCADLTRFDPGLCYVFDHASSACDAPIQVVGGAPTVVLPCELDPAVPCLP